MSMDDSDLTIFFKAALCSRDFILPCSTLKRSKGVVLIISQRAYLAMFSFIQKLSFDYCARQRNRKTPTGFTVLYINAAP